MALRQTNWARALVMFVIAWLIGVYIYEVVRDHFNQSVSFAIAASTFVLNGVARWRATKNVKDANWKFYAWMSLPLVLFIAVPIVVKLVAYLQSEEQVSWYDYIVPILPFILKLGVPAAALAWVYWSIGRLDRKIEKA